VAARGVLRYKHMFTIGFLGLISIILAGLAILAFEVAMFIDMLQNEYLTDRDKIIWAVAMVLVHPFVAIYYYFTARNRSS
jgi:sterol desaturase/sphingolipid hydroxylase (fatty acid hydroxylase superfamily)